ncbi:TlyA family RNA methyltransferase [Candidatus Hydrogenedentota bacterium]
MKKDRLDIVMVERGLAPSRSKARALIMSGSVRVDGKTVTKSGTGVSQDVDIQIEGKPFPYVSRGGLKLEAALDEFGLDVTGLTAADIGASTGGFTDCLLQRGVSHVYAIDVGYGQFDWKLRNDPRVTLFERTNIRHFDSTRIPGVELAVADLSFISLRIVLPSIKSLLAPGARVITLIKPQFEAGRDKVGKGGVVHDPAVREEAVDNVIEAAEVIGFEVSGRIESPIQGPAGNREFLVMIELRPK